MLGREPVRMEIERVGAYLAGQVVMVTGAGGSIGAELCRQISRVAPRSLVLVDHAEDNLFEILRELEEDRHVRTAVPVLADCREEERMREVLTEHRPSVVFHAAAYKHVTMMEVNPVEAIRNNALATRVVARIAAEAQVGELRAGLDRQGGQAGDRDGRLEGARGVGRRGRRAAVSRHQVRDGPVRQRARLLGLGGADLPPPDRRRRPGDGHRPADEALLHDDPGGGAADHPRRVAERGQRRGVRARDGRADRDHRPRRDDDPAVRARARARHRDRDRRRSSRGEAPRGPVQPVRAPAAHPRPEDRAGRARAARPRVGRGDLRRDQPARARGRRGRARAARGQAVELPLRRPRARRGLAASADSPDSPDSPRRLPARDMQTIPFALSVHHFISSVGADAGFAAIIAVALLVLLYFAQARETSTLRRRADEAGQRVEELEGAAVRSLSDAGRGARRPRSRSARPSPRATRRVRRRPPRRRPRGVGAAARLPAGRARRRRRAGAGGRDPADSRPGRRPPASASRRPSASVDRPGRPAPPTAHAAAPGGTVGGGNGSSTAPSRPPRRPMQRTVAAAVGRPVAAGRGPPLARRLRDVPARRPRAGPVVRRAAAMAVRPPPRRTRSPDACSRCSAVLLLVGAVVAGVIVDHERQPRLERERDRRGDPPRAAREPPRPRRWPAVNPVDRDRRRCSTAPTSPGWPRAVVGPARHRRLQAGLRRPTPPIRRRRRPSSRTCRGDKPRRARGRRALKLRPTSVQPIDSTTQQIACPPSPLGCTSPVIVTVGSDLAGRSSHAVHRCENCSTSRSGAASRGQRRHHPRARPRAVDRRGRRAWSRSPASSSTSSSSAGAPRSRPATSRRKLERYRAARDPGRARRHADRARDQRRPARRADRLAARARARAHRDLRRDDHARARAQARADRAAGARVHGPLRGRVQGRHGEIMAPYIWVEQMQAGARGRRLEGDRRGARGGTAGIFRHDGEVRDGPDRRDRARRSRPDQILFEAPRKDQQVWFVRRFGANVNLGNIPPARSSRSRRSGSGCASDTLGIGGRPWSRHSAAASLLARHGETNDNRRADPRSRGSATRR